MTTGSATPVRAVREAIDAGATTLAQVASETGLPPDVVSAVVDHLGRSGALQVTTMVAGCPADGCGGCASGGEHDAPGCGAPGPSASRHGPVVVRLGRRD